MNSLNSAPKRKYPRSPFKKPVAMTVKGTSEVSQGLEIGEGGISLVTDLVLEIDTQMVVNFYIPHGDFFSLRAIVKNTGKPTLTEPDKMIYGLSFIETSLPLKRQIRAYVARTSHELDKFKLSV